MTTQQEKTPLPQEALDALGEQLPDSLHPVLQFIVDKILFIIAGIVLLIAAVGGTAVYNATQAASLAQAQENLNRIIAIENSDERLTELTALQETVPDALHTALLLEIAHALSASKEYGKAADIWKEIATKEPAPLQTTARLAQAMALVEQGSPRQALALLETLRKEAPQPYQGLVLYQLGNVATALQDYPKALEAYEELKLTAGPSPNDGFIDYQIQQARKNSTKTP